MEFLLGVTEPEILAGARAGAVTGRFPQLRFVSLVGREPVAEAVDALPPHLRMRVILDPTPQLLASGEIQKLLTADPVRARRMLPDVAAEDIITWDELPAAYERWLIDHHLPAQRRRRLTPDGLFPVGWRGDRMRIELIGCCEAWRIGRQAEAVAAETGTELSIYHLIQNHPGALPQPPAEGPTTRIVLPPFRYMHPATLDAWLLAEDPERLFAETVTHMHAYMDSVVVAGSTVPLYVGGFLAPPMNPEGVFAARRDLADPRYFVRCLNDALAEWCERTEMAFLIDVEALAAAVGAVEESATFFYGHRTSVDHEFDDATDREHGIPTIPAELDVGGRGEEFLRALLVEVVHREVIRGGRARVRAVIFDLDNTLWRGVASEGTAGSWNGRPQGLVEAIHILRRRGVYAAVASRNDEAWIREHWDDILHVWPEDPLAIPLSLDDFDALRIDFRPKSETVGEILDDLAVLPEHAVFVDDNPLERESVQAAFPQLRVLGAEINRVRLELIHSPFTQSHVRTAEDGLRAASVRRHAGLNRARAAGSAEDFLDSLGLRCEMRTVTDLASADGVRALALINKTNQWTLNGERMTSEAVAEQLAAGARLLVADVRDAHAAHGIVAAALVDAGRRRLTSMVVSCRVIGMGVDDAVMAELVARFGALTVAFGPTDRNRAAAAAIERWTGAPSDGEAEIAYLDRPGHVALEPGDAVATPA